MYDYLVVGAGLYGAVFAHEAKKKGKKVLVIDKRPNIAGNVYTEDVEDIHVHKYGAHIFHTNNRRVWEYVNQFAEFNRFTNSRLRITTGSCIRCRLTCTRLIKCGELLLRKRPTAFSS
jgi:UDP-galactopyranose mutase